MRGFYSESEERVCRGCSKLFFATFTQRHYCSGCSSTDKTQRYRDRLKREALAILGDRCANPDCRWVNLDGTRGCTDPRCLNVDHKEGGGCRERKQTQKTMWRLYKAVIANPEKFQRLCCNCNWIKRHTHDEV